MGTDNQNLQSFHIDIKGFRPSYDIEERDDRDGFDESFRIMIRGSATLNLPGAADLVVIQVSGSRLSGSDWANSDEGSVLGIGLVKAMTDGLFVETFLPFDAALKVSGCFETGAIGKVVIDCDPINAVGDRSYVRRVRFSPA
jgi:hypothetical protein